MLSMFLSQVWPIIAAGFGVLAGLVAVYFSGHLSGKKEAKVDQLEDNAEARRKRDEALSETDKMDDDAIRNRARERMRASKNTNR